ncbi:GtrA family protein [Candidatus Peregrinibacteria bacterium]|nr:GtrA family protein [Candidatus Peregrinibacteria bacterium]
MKLLKEITKFLITGGTSAVITLVILNIFLFFNYPLFISSIIGYAGGIVNSFFLNKNWTFRFKNNNKKFPNIFIIFMLFNIAMMFLFGYLNLGFLAVTQSKFISQILSILTTTVMNFLTYKYIIFRK